MIVLGQTIVPSISPTVSPTTEATSTVAELAAKVEETVSGFSWSTFKSDLGTTILESITSFALEVAFALIIFFIGKKLIKLLLKLVKRGFNRSNMEEGISGFLLNLIKYVSYAILLVIVAEIVGIQTTSFVALLGSAGVAAGLALQGSLSNLAGGVLILVTKPFKVGDYIIAEQKEGTVVRIDIFYTNIVTVDNKRIVIPNGTISNMDVINVTNEPTRRLDLIIPVSYRADIDYVRSVILGVCQKNELVLHEEQIDILLYEFGSSSVNMAVRVWVATENYWPLKWQLQESLKKALDQAGIEIPFNQLDVTILNQSK